MKTIFTLILLLIFTFCCKRSDLPIVITSPISEVRWDSATAGGEVISEGSSPVTARGICITLNKNDLPRIITNFDTWYTTDGSGSGTFTSKTKVKYTSDIVYTHHLRAYATNKEGTAYGDTLSFFPKSKPPTSLSIELKSVTPKPTTAIINFYFDHEPSYSVDERGFCYGTSSTPTIEGSHFVIIMTTQLYNMSSPTITIENLLPNTVYFTRGYVKNESGIYYTPEMSFKTTEGEITDINGNIYQIKTIGSQVWTIENLKTANFTDGTVIPFIQDNLVWSSATTSASCNYNNTYGKLYNYYAVIDSRKLCPAGWHVPSDDEWKTLEMYLGMTQNQVDATGSRGTDEGGKLKKPGCPDGWSCSNIGATNSSGFSAIGGGYRYDNGIFSGQGYNANFWSTSEYNSTSAWSRSLSNNYVQIIRLNNSKGFGFSIRCIKD